MTDRFFPWVALVPFLAAGCGGGSGSPSVAAPHYVKSQPRVTSPIAIENAKAGSDGWVLTQPARAQEVEGYASPISVRAGEPVSLMVNVDETHGVRWELYRVGYYGGHGGRLVATGGPVTVDPQPSCPVDHITGLVECHWAEIFRIETGADWISGHYLAKLVRDDGFDVYVPFILREREPRAPGLVQASVTTWQAYNTWGGTSLYHNSLPAPRVYTPGAAFRVSFDRPIEQSTPLANSAPWEAAEDFGDGLFLRYEHPLVAYLERRGYDVAYTTNVDIDSDPSTLLTRRIFLSVGHDEYWSVRERDALDSARDNGVSLAFLSANVGYWRIRLDPSSDGTPNRIVTCYKGDPSDPLKGTPVETTRFRDPPYARPENALVGVMYDLYTRIDGFPLVITRPESWVFDGMNLGYGDSLGNIVGYEWDHVFDNGKEPAGLQVLGASPAFGAYGTSAPSNMTVYEPTPENFVFAAGTIEFAWGAGRTGYTNGRTEEVINNLMVRAGVPPGTPSEPDSTDMAESAGTVADVTSVAGRGAEGFVDGPRGAAEFDTPTGIAAGPDGTLYVSESRNHRIRAISPDGGVSTLAGCGPTGQTNGDYRNGDGTHACFDSPTGIALGQDGLLYVADSGNSAIRRVTLGGHVTTYVGGESGKVDGSLHAARLSYPEGVAFAPDGTLYVADSGNDRVCSITSAGVTTIASGIKWPTGITVGGDGTVYVIASGEGRIYSISGGISTVLADQSGTDGNRDGPAAQALLRPASGLALVGRTLLFSDTANNAVRILDLDTHTIRRFAGTGHYGAALGSGREAELVLPRGLALLGGNVLLADSGNHRVVSLGSASALTRQ